MTTHPGDAVLKPVSAFPLSAGFFALSGILPWRAGYPAFSSIGTGSRSKSRPSRSWQ